MTKIPRFGNRNSDIRTFSKASIHHQVGPRESSTFIRMLVRRYPSAALTSIARRLPLARRFARRGSAAPAISSSRARIGQRRFLATMHFNFSTLPKRLPDSCPRYERSMAKPRSQRLLGLEIRVGVSVSTGRETENCPSARIATSAHEVSPVGSASVLLAKTSMPVIREIMLNYPTGIVNANPEDRLHRSDSPKAAGRPVILKPRARCGEPAQGSPGILGGDSARCFT